MGASRKGDAPPRTRRLKWLGALAQLGERYNGIVEVSGSIPLGSTISPDLLVAGRGDGCGLLPPHPGANLGFIGDFPTLADEFSSAGVFRV